MGVVRWAKERLVNWMVKDIYIRHAKFGTGTIGISDILTFPVSHDHPPTGGGQLGFVADALPGPGEDRVQYWDRDPGVARPLAHTAELGWQGIETIELGAPGLISFTSIPQDFDHLKLIIQARGSVLSTNLTTASIRFNGVSTSTYFSTLHFASHNTSTWGNSSADGQQTQWPYGVMPSANSDANNFSAIEVLIPQYSDTGIRKMAKANGGAFANTSPQYHYCVSACNFNSTAAISQIDIGQNPLSNLVAGSRAGLYGLVEP